MPKKNKKIINGRLKRSTTISKLMAISIIVDKHIYNNELISFNQAEKFLKEVTSLKIKCKGDERSLQVIDKLQNYMKIIMKEKPISDTDVKKSNNTVYKNFGIKNDEKNCKAPLNETPKRNHLKRSNGNNNHTLVRTQTNTNILEPMYTETPQITSNESNHQVLITKQNQPSGKNLENKSKDVYFNDNIQEKKLHTQKIRQCENYPSNNVISVKQHEKVEKIINNMVNNKLDVKENGTISNTSKEKISKKKTKSKAILSWIENIKLVREICPDEHTDIQIQDNFWTDLSLPFILDFDD